jgi:hypothetical protein
MSDRPAFKDMPRTAGYIKASRLADICLSHLLTSLSLITPLHNSSPNMQLPLLSITLLALPLASLAQNPANDPYVPKQVNCTDDVLVRAASNVSTLTHDREQYRGSPPAEG